MKNRYYYLFILFLVGVTTISKAQDSQCMTACWRDTLLHDTSVHPIWSPDSSKFLINKQDTAGVYQIYLGYKGSTKPLICISYKDTTGNCCGILRRWHQRNKLQVHWHPSGKWVICVVEREWYNELTYTPYSLLLTFLECGWKTDMWACTPTGDHWYQLEPTISAQGNGVVGPVFTPDGKRAAWAQEQDSSKTTDVFGLWYMMRSDFVDTGATGPAFIKTTNINPPGSRWIEPGNFSPDGKYLMISSDIGMTNAQGQDQFVLNINTLHTFNLTNSPKIWDEHGFFSPDGHKIIFMSSYPYKSDTNSNKTTSIKTEFMLIDAVYPDSVMTLNPCDSVYYPGLEQLTHFCVPGYPEYAKPTNGIAAAGFWSHDGSKFYGQDLISGYLYDNWIVVFNGSCGNAVTGINEVQQTASDITVYPNPVGGQTLNVKFKNVQEGKASIKIVDVTGREVIPQFTTDHSTFTIDTGNLTPGIYFVQVIMPQGSNVVKFIKQ